MKIDPSKIINWWTATKTKPISVKHLSAVVSDSTILPKLQIKTLEGAELFGDNVVVCVGESGDIWQQTAKKVFQKYNAVDITKDGWIIFNPKPDNIVSCVKITQEFIYNWSPPWAIKPPNDEMYKAHDFYINGLWGNDDHPEFGKNVQWGDNGDYLCQSKTDPNDVWIVKEKLFDNTYKMI